MSICDDFFEEAGILFNPDNQDDAVWAVWSADFYDPEYKKELILCWFDTTFGEWNGNRFNLRDSRARMSLFLNKGAYDTFEELLADTPNRAEI